MHIRMLEAASTVLIYIIHSVANATFFNSQLYKVYQNTLFCEWLFVWFVFICGLN